ncbi:MAG: hypothetical protein ACP5OZ_00320 [Candidatus Woesearchaeota archaeon]
MEFKIAPLKASFMAASILGMIISAIFIIPDYPDWGMAFLILFAIMFISSLISMAYAPIELADKIGLEKEQEEIEKIAKKIEKEDILKKIKRKMKEKNKNNKITKSI